MRQVRQLSHLLVRQRRLLKDSGFVPRVIVTDKLGSHQVAHRELLARPSIAGRSIFSNRAENSHQPTTQRERAMKRFKSHGYAQRFLSVFSDISPHFRPDRHGPTALECRTEMADRFVVGQEAAATDVAA